MKEKIAIIGAGISGLVLAEKLNEKFDVEIFEKSRGVGGRMAVKYFKNFQFDKGTQHFTCKSEEFFEFLKRPKKAGAIDLWNARFAEIDFDEIQTKRVWSDEFKHFVGVPKMNSLAKFLAQDKKIYFQTEIVKCQKIDEKWILKTKNGENFDGYKYLIFTAPVEQTLNLIDKNFSEIEVLRNKKMLGCFSLMVGLKKPLKVEFDAALVKNSIVSWISVDSSKPERPGGFSLLANSTNLWAEENMEKDLQTNKELLVQELCKIVKFDKNEIEFCDLHRWRYANIEKQEGQKSLFDKNLNLGVCSDFMIQGRVEAAFLSASDLAKKISA